MPLAFVDTQVAMKSLVPIVDHEAGARVFFHGTVRANNHHKAVRFLDYQAYELLAKSEFLSLEATAKQLFNVHSIEATHLLGRAEVGDIGVSVQVVSRHRKEAFLAARFIMDELKKKIPIWKGEYYQDGTKSFDQGHCECSLSSAPLWAPVHKALEADAIEPQILTQKKILLIGAGGLGCPLALNLAALGIENLRIFDGDVVNERNLARQFIFSRDDIGRHKTQLVADFLQARFSLEIAIHNTMLDAHDAIRYFPEVDCVVDASDCMRTKMMAARYAYRLKVPFISASVFRNEGELNVIVEHTGGCFFCYRRESGASSCNDIGVYTHTCGFIAARAAQAVLEVLSETRKKNSMWLFTKSGSLEIALEKDRHCHSCSPLKSYRVEAS